MTSPRYRFDNPDKVLIGTIGVPGEREFYLQVQDASRIYSFALEKSQAQALADRFSEILREAKIGRSNANRDTAPLDTPIESEFELGVMAITWKYETQLISFEAQGITGSSGEQVFQDLVADDELDAPPILRITLTPTQVQSFVQRAFNVIKAGRQPCIFCGGPINLDGHICPRAN